MTTAPAKSSEPSASDLGDPASPSRDRASHGAADGVSTLRASPAIAQWQPLETAPKDGRRLLMTGLNQTVRWTCIGYYSPAHGATWVSDESFGFGPGKLQGPTNWWPLPAPPEGS